MLIACLNASVFCFAQQFITSVVTNNTSSSPVSYNNIPGAGIRTATNTLASSWDSAGSNFALSYNNTADNIKSITQLTVIGHSQPFIPQPSNSFVRVRRQPTPYVGDTREHYNFWSACSAIPATGSISGTFSLIAPEVTSPAVAFMSNNINSGYDNIFQNTINSIHAGNVERLDCIIPKGLKPNQQFDADNSGVVIFDRGTGDPFKVSLIMSLDANNDPLTYGPLISVTAAQFGPNLLPAPFQYCILVHDPLYGTNSRPSTTQSQNIRGVIVTLSELGLSPGQRFYGYSVFGNDVIAANPDWTTYPNNTNLSSQLDPINVMGIFKDITAILPVPVDFNLTKQNNKPLVQFTAYDVPREQTIVIERSVNGRDFIEIGHKRFSSAGTYQFIDEEPLSGILFYRLRSTEGNGKIVFSETKNLRMNNASFSLWPNPANENVRITIPETWQMKKLSACVYDVTGRMIRKEDFIPDKRFKKFSLGHLKKGIYLFQLVNPGTEASEFAELIVN